MEALAHAGHAVHVICDPGTPAVERCRAAGIPFTEMEYPSRLAPSAIRVIRHRIEQDKIELVHALTNRALSNSLFALRGNPAVRVVGYRGTMGHLSRLDPASWMTYLNSRVDRIICVSDAVRQYLLGMGVPDARLVVIHKGHDPAWYRIDSHVNLSEFGVPVDAFVVGFTGNMRPVKGVDVLLRALALLPQKSKIHALLVGEVRDPKVERLAQIPEIVSRAHFVGFRKDAPQLAGSCDAAVMPSIEREGLPKAVIEAMAQGLPPVVSKVGGMPELVEHGVSGLVVPAKDAPALAEALLSLEQDKEKTEILGAGARERIEGPFHISHTVKKTLTLYEELL